MLLSLKLLSLATEPLRSAPAFIAALEGLQDEYVIAVIARHARHLVRPFQPVDRAAGDVVCRQRHRRARRSRWPW